MQILVQCLVTMRQYEAMSGLLDLKTKSSFLHLYKSMETKE